MVNYSCKLVRTVDFSTGTYVANYVTVANSLKLYLLRNQRLCNLQLYSTVLQYTVLQYYSTTTTVLQYDSTLSYSNFKTG